jgi:hypothetical protein
MSRMPRPPRPPRGGLVAVAIAALLCFAPQNLAADGAAASGTAGSSASAALQANADALPDLDEGKPENPFLRFEIVALGSYPITLFYSDLGFDFYRYAQNNYSSTYIPLFNSIALKDSERWSRLGVALGISAFVGLVDAVIHLYKVNEARRKFELPKTAAPVAPSAPLSAAPSAAPQDGP